MSEPAMGARVKYCGHDGYFIADIFKVGNCNVVRANGPVTGDTIKRPAKNITHELSDFPKPGFWGSQVGVFVVPCEQVKKV